MADDACLVFEPDLVAYDFGSGHPMSPVRVDLTFRLALALGVVGESGLPVIAAPQVDPALLARVHTPAYIAAVQAVQHPYEQNQRYGLGTPDCPSFAGMHEASAHIVGASVEAARAVWSGEVRRAANIVGGLHHAMPSAASGFCIYNDVAVAIQWLLEQGAERVAYVDVDVHHGDGVQEIFYDDPRVLTVSLHETPGTLFPGTGHASEVGGPGALGSAVNVALPPGTGDAGWLRAFDAIYFGAVGWPGVPDHVSLWGLRLAICQGFDQYACIRPVRLLPGVPSPLKSATAGEGDRFDESDGMGA